MTPSSRACLAWLIFVLLTAGAAAQPVPPPAEIAGAGTDTLSAQIEVFAQDLERLRRFMGAPKVSALNIGLRSTLPRDLYFQALSLWQQTDRLLFEVMRLHEKPPPTPAGDIQFQDVLLRLQDAHRILRQVMQELRIPAATEPVPVTQAGGTDTFTDMLELNRKLNLLLERHLAPSDVYAEVTLAVGYSARLLARYPESTRIPVEPPFEPNKQPGDVYLRLVACLRSITHIFDTFSLPVLQIDTSQTDLNALNPGDVFLVATMIVSQLDFLYKHLEIAKAPPQPVYPGLRFPAHTYQRAGILQAQLAQLERLLPNDQAASGVMRQDSNVLER